MDKQRKKSHIICAFQPKLGIDLQLTKTFGAPNLKDNGGTVRSSGPDTTIWLFLPRSQVKCWGKMGKQKLKLNALLNILVDPMGLHPGIPGSAGAKINPLRASVKAVSQFRIVASWTRPGMCRMMKL